MELYVGGGGGAGASNVVVEELLRKDADGRVAELLRNVRQKKAAWAHEAAAWRYDQVRATRCARR